MEVIRGDRLPKNLAERLPPQALKKSEIQILEQSKSKGSNSTCIKKLLQRAAIWAKARAFGMRRCRRQGTQPTNKISANCMFKLKVRRGNVGSNRSVPPETFFALTGDWRDRVAHHLEAQSVPAHTASSLNMARRGATLRGTDDNYAVGFLNWRRDSDPEVPEALRLHPRPLLEYLCGPTSRQHVRNPTQRTCINESLSGNRFRPETAPLGTTSLIESTPDIQRTSVASHPEVWVHPIPKSKTDPQITESNSWWLRTPSATDPFHSTVNAILAPVRIELTSPLVPIINYSRPSPTAEIASG
ncbi:hypothetical protein B0H14DRAFT_2584754 [Mycena olivaceomarginata]|nr:hypothetical protein B0H14DRAFT_2584754 [Mycena olivaceomarginata]